MSYRTRRYEEGLGGKKPGSIYIDEEGHRAQTRGYEDHLRNEDLAERISQAYERSSDSDSSYESSPPKPLTQGQRMFWWALTFFLLYLGIKSALWVTYGTHHDTFEWGSFLGFLLIVPGGIFLWPGVILVSMLLDKEGFGSYS